VRASRAAAGVTLGASPRATLALFRAGQALAALAGRGFVLPDDIKRLAGPVLTHRLVLSAEHRFDGAAAAGLIDDLLGRVPAPVEG
jgi:MoxR-like ATPase